MTLITPRSLTTGVQEYNRIDDLDGLQLVWRRLLGQTRGASFFQSLDWLRTYWQHYGAGQQLRVLVVQGADGPLGILPLVVRPEETRVGTVQVCTYPLSDWGSFYGPIGPNPTATLMLGLRHLQNTERTWDMLDLRWVHREGVDYGRTENAMRETGLAPYARVWAESSLVELPGTWEEYAASRGTEWRRKLRQNERRLSELGEIGFIRHRPDSAAAGDGDPGAKHFAAARRVASASWQGASTTGTTLSHDEVCKFLTDMHGTASRAGASDLSLLTIGGRAAAFVYGYHYEGNFFVLRIGYDPAVAKHGAGKVLLARVIADSIARGDHTLDLGPGAEEYKRTWRTRVAPAYSYGHFAGTGRGQALRLKRAAEQWWHKLVG